MVKRWWLKVALALLLCAVWSALGTGVWAQGTVPPVSLSAEEQRLIESIECVSLEGQQYCYGLGFVALEMKSPAWYSYWAEVLRGGDANAAYVKQVLTQRRALSAEAK